MTTEPGVLPKEYDELDFSKLAPQLQHDLKMIHLEVVSSENNTEDKRQT